MKPRELWTDYLLLLEASVCSRGLRGRPLQKVVERLRFQALQETRNPRPSLVLVSEVPESEVKEKLVLVKE